MWWSRPEPWAMGVRPNSPPQMMRVVFEHAAGLEVFDEGCGGFVNVAGDGFDSFLHAAVVIPSTVVEFG